MNTTPLDDMTRIERAYAVIDDLRAEYGALKAHIAPLRTELAAEPVRRGVLCSEIAGLKRQLAELAHMVDEYRGKFAVATNDLRSEKNHSAFLKIENAALEDQIMQTVKELDEDLEKRIDTGALIKELRQNLRDQKTQCTAANGMIADLQKENQIMRTALTHRDAERAKLTDAATFDKDTIEHVRKGLKLERDKRVKLQEELVKVKETNTIFASEVVALEKHRREEAAARSKNQCEAYEKLVNELRFDIAKAEVRTENTLFFSI